MDNKTLKSIKYMREYYYEIYYFVEIPLNWTIINGLKLIKKNPSYELSNLSHTISNFLNTKFSILIRKCMGKCLLKILY